ncbi:MAG: hypothetical protein AB7I50_11310 [Vicinamibacterales bacterium]
MRVPAWRLAWPLALLVGVLACLPFWPSVHAGFLSDDWFFVEAYHGAQPPFASFVWRAFTALERIPTNFYRPLPFVTLAAQMRFSGTEPYGLHVANLLLHGTAAALLFVLLRRLLEGRSMAAAAAALFFAWFPRRVETVAWLSCRPDLLATVLALASLLLFDAYLRSRNRIALGTALAAWMLALASKESVVLVAVAHLVLAWREPAAAEPRPVPFRRAMARAAMFAGVVPFFLLWRRVVIGSWIGGYGASVLRVDAGTAMAFVKHATYQVVPPFEYASSLELSAVPTPLLAVVVAGLGALALWVLWLGRRGATALVGAVWLVAGILPVVTLPLSLSSTLNDRLLYLPAVGIAALIAVAFTGVRSRAGAVVIAVWLLGSAGWSFALSARWARAGDMSATLLEKIAEQARVATDTPIYVAAVPDSLGGAYLLRNGIGHALAVSGVPNPMRVHPLTVYFVSPGDEGMPVRAAQGDATQVRVESVDAPAVITALTPLGELGAHQTEGPPDRFGRFKAASVRLEQPGRFLLVTPREVADVPR